MHPASVVFFRFFRKEPLAPRWWVRVWWFFDSLTPCDNPGDTYASCTVCRACRKVRG